jgi:pyrroloquinoline quinone biosynthesis protein B
MRIALHILLFLSCLQGFSQSVFILGVAQDGGYPHIGCKKNCCERAWSDRDMRRMVTSFALVDSSNKKWWLFEASPDIKEQLHYFSRVTRGTYKYLPDGIFITHAHIGHYTGLMQLGREAMGAKGVPVFVLPKLRFFLENNGPWSQLVRLNNISLQTLDTSKKLELAKDISVETFTVPHRDEYSETAGIRITTANKKYLFIPDIDKWQKWSRNIIDEVEKVDIALLDATFYDAEELPGRRMEEVPHPFVVETIKLFENAPAATKTKIHFIHLNHTNRLLWDDAVQKQAKGTGFNLATQGEHL